MKRLANGWTMPAERAEPIDGFPRCSEIFLDIAAIVNVLLAIALATGMALSISRTG